MALCSLFATAPLTFAQVPAPTGAAPAAGITLPGHVPILVNSSALLGPVLGIQPVSLALTLPLRNRPALDTLLHDLYDASSPTHGQFLTPAQFTTQFGPTQADYDALTQWATAHGLTVTGTNPTRTLLDVTASAFTVQNAFNIHLLRYSDLTGREFFAPDADPTVDSSLTGILSGVVGLDNATVIRPSGAVTPSTSPSGGTGQLGYLGPRDIKAAYNLNGLSANGAGQTLAVFELDGYDPKDIAAYESAYGLPSVPVQTVPVDGYSGSAGSNTFEVAGLAPFYHLYSPHNGDHFFTDDYAEYNGLRSSGYWTDDGVSCYVYPGPTSGATALYRAYYAQTGQHFYTASLSEYNGLGSGWTLKGARAYVLPAY